MHELITAGYFSAVQELNMILRVDDPEALEMNKKHKNKRLIKPVLIGDKAKIRLIADVLRTCQEETDQSKQPFYIQTQVFFIYFIAHK